MLFPCWSVVACFPVAISLGSRPLWMLAGRGEYNVESGSLFHHFPVTQLDSVLDF